MKKIFLLIPFWTVAAVAQIKPVFELPLVKVVSSSCESTREESNGSGILIEYQGQNYVVTSEHVLMDPEKKGCSRIVTQSNKKLTAEKIIAEWGNGLALLKTSNVANESVFHWQPSSEGNEAALDLGQGLRVVGFPANSYAPTDDRNGKVAALDRYRHYMPLLKGMVEVAHTVIEPGLSGAPAYSFENQWVGLISHHVIYPEGRGESRGTVQLAAPSIQGFVIDRATIDAFLKRVLVQQQTVPVFQRIRSQAGSAETVLVAGLEFSMESAEFKTIGSVRTPSGELWAAKEGGDLVGVSGKSTNSAGRTVNVKLSTKDFPTSSVSFAQSDWMARLKRMLPRRNVQIESIAVVDSESLSVNELRFSSLNQFFSQLGVQGAQPLYQANGEVANPVPAELTNDLLLAIKAIRQNPHYSDQYKSFLDQIEFYATGIMARQQHGILTVSMIEKLISDDSVQPVWDYLMLLPSDPKNPGYLPGPSLLGALFGLKEYL